MAVGRVELWNFASIEHDMCWARGFRLITANPSASFQLKLLDRNRNWLIRRLRQFLGQSMSEPPVAAKPKKRRQYLYYGNPFSYHFQLGERNRDPA